MLLSRERQVNPLFQRHSSVTAVVFLSLCKEVAATAFVIEWENIATQNNHYSSCSICRQKHNSFASQNYTNPDIGLSFPYLLFGSFVGRLYMDGDMCV